MVVAGKGFAEFSRAAGLVSNQVFGQTAIFLLSIDGQSTANQWLTWLQEFPILYRME